jgi:hypothetical protein
MSGLEDSQVKFMALLIAELRTMNDHLKEIKEHVKGINDRADEKLKT